MGYFSGVTVPKRDVIETIQKFNIQVNNLTQVSNNFFALIWVLKFV